MPLHSPFIVNSIESCKILVSLPLRGLRCLIRLETLFIYDCNDLNLVMDNNLEKNGGSTSTIRGLGMQSLRSLTLIKLHKLEILPSWILHNANILKHIHISM